MVLLILFPIFVFFRLRKQGQLFFVSLSSSMYSGQSLLLLVCF